MLVNPLLLIVLAAFLYGSYFEWGCAPFALAAVVALTRPWLDAGNPSPRLVRSGARDAA